MQIAELTQENAQLQTQLAELQWQLEFLSVSSEPLGSMSQRASVALASRPMEW